MIVREKESDFAKIYRNPRKTVKEDSGELMLLNLLCDGQAEKVQEMFSEKQEFIDELSYIDAPHGRYEGRAAIKEFAENWLASFGADRAEIDPVVQTIGGGRAVTESIVDFFKDNEMIRRVPIIVVGDLKANNMLDSARIYFHFKNVPGMSAYRAPVFKSMHLTEASPYLLTGAVRGYFEALHDENGVNVEKVMSLLGETCAFGGYVVGDIFVTDREEIEKAYSRMSSYIPQWLKLRVETIIDDGISCVVEWQHIIRKAGQEIGNRLCESGISVYERGQDGKLCAVRILDYANCESMIDWSKENITLDEAKKINYAG